MFIATLVLSAALGASTALVADETRQVPSLPNTWPSDFRDRMEATPTCPGGTPESLRRHMDVSAPFVSAEAYQAALREELPLLDGVQAGDVFHQFHFRSELPGNGFWGFSGYVVVRSGCIVHADITAHDN